MDVPTFQANENDLKKLISFIYKHEQLLKEFGAIKIQPSIECKLALKKRRKNLTARPIAERIVRMSKNKSIYSVKKAKHIGTCAQKRLVITDERSFWSTLPYSDKERRNLNISFLLKKSFFTARTNRIYFNIQRLPSQSLLKIGSRKVTQRFVPCVRRAHGPGAIFPLTSARQRLFSIDYHHEGGAHHWYVIPTREREVLERIVNKRKSSICLDHGKLLIDPSMLDRNRIRYHRIVQYPNEFVVLSAGTLAQSFTEGASWSESIAFALPSWIQEGHATISAPQCQCKNNSVEEPVDINLFRHELIQRYINVELDISQDCESLTGKSCSLDLS